MLESTHLNKPRSQRGSFLKTKEGRGGWPMRSRKFKERNTYENKCANPGPLENISIRFLKERVTKA